MHLLERVGESRKRSAPPGEPQVALSPSNGFLALSSLSAEQSGIRAVSRPMS